MIGKWVLGAGLLSLVVALGGCVPDAGEHGSQPATAADSPTATTTTSTGSATAMAAAGGAGVGPTSGASAATSSTASTSSPPSGPTPAELAAELAEMKQRQQDKERRDRMACEHDCGQAGHRCNMACMKSDAVQSKCIGDCNRTKAACIRACGR